MWGSWLCPRPAGLAMGCSMCAFPVAVTHTSPAHHKPLQGFLYQAGCEGEADLMHRCLVGMSTHTHSAAAAAGAGAISRAGTASFIQCHLFSHSHIIPSIATCVPSHPVPSPPVPSHPISSPIPSRPVPSRPVPSHLISHPIPSHLPSHPIPSCAAWCPKAGCCQRTQAQHSLLPAAASPALQCTACVELLLSLCPFPPCCCPP